MTSEKQTYELIDDSVHKFKIRRGSKDHQYSLWHQGKRIAGIYDLTAFDSFRGEIQSACHDETKNKFSIDTLTSAVIFSSIIGFLIGILIKVS